MLTSVLTGLVVGAAGAQETQPEKKPEAAPAATAPATVPAPAPASEERRGSDEIVVTGSRLRRDSFLSSSPVSVITNERSELEGQIDAAEILQGSTQGSGNFQLNSTFTGFVVEGGPGINSISLRGLGATRTLVLLNGKRLPPSGTRGQVGAVDLNTIPSSMVDRVEILRDGASAIYGSDAIGGVINLITRQNIDGGRIAATASLPEESGGEQFRIDGAYGWNFDRGNLTVGAEYFKRENLATGDRKYLACSEDYVFNAQTGARADLVDPRTGAPKCFNLLQGLVRVFAGPNAGEWVPDASVTGGPVPGWRQIRVGQTAIPAGAATANLLLARNYRSPLNDERSALSPVSRTTLYSTFRYDLPANIEFNAEALFNRRESEQINYAQLFSFNGTGAASNTMIQVGARNQFGGRADAVSLRPAMNEQTVDTYRVNAGLAGGFGPSLSSWKWDAYVQYGRGEGEYGGNIIKGNEFIAAINGCPAVPLTAVAPAPGCIPFNWFTPGAVTHNGYDPAQFAYFGGFEFGSTTYTQKLAEVAVSGDLFQLPAGAVDAAFGVHWREESIDDIPGLNTRTGNNIASTSAGQTKGTDTVREAFTEIGIPLFKNSPLGQSFDLNLSGRYTDYDSYGSDEVYKVAANWQIIPELRLRYSKGTNYRAPALFELFLANQTGFLGQGSIDPCIEWGFSADTQLRTRCQALGLEPNYPGRGATATIITGGGKGVLKSETANNYNIGIVYTPSEIDLKLSVDYSEITIEEGVDQLGAGNISFLCYTGRGDNFCGLIQRDLRGLNPATNPGNPAANPDFGRIISINNSYVNTSIQKARQIDMEAEYRHEFNFGNLTVNSSATWNLESYSELLGLTTNAEDLIYAPEFVADLNTTFDRGDWRFFWGVDVIGKSDNRAFNAENVPASQGDLVVPREGNATNTRTARVKANIDQWISHDFSARYELDTWRFTVGVSNAFAAPPPRVSASQVVGWYTRVGNTVAGGPYDIIGRRYFVTVNKRF